MVFAAPESRAQGRMKTLNKDPEAQGRAQGNKGRAQGRHRVQGGLRGGPEANRVWQIISIMKLTI